jgi:hypothetical protein
MTLLYALDAGKPRLFSRALDEIIKLGRTSSPTCDPMHDYQISAIWMRIFMSDSERSVECARIFRATLGESAHVTMPRTYTRDTTIMLCAINWTREDCHEYACEFCHDREMFAHCVECCARIRESGSADYFFEYLREHPGDLTENVCSPCVIMMSLACAKHCSRGDITRIFARIGAQHIGSFNETSDWTAKMPRILDARGFSDILADIDEFAYSQCIPSISTRDTLSTHILCEISTHYSDDYARHLHSYLARILHDDRADLAQLLAHAIDDLSAQYCGHIPWYVLCGIVGCGDARLTRELCELLGCDKMRDIFSSTITHTDNCQYEGLILFSGRANMKLDSLCLAESARIFASYLCGMPIDFGSKWSAMYQQMHLDPRSTAELGDLLAIISPYFLDTWNKDDARRYVQDLESHFSSSVVDERAFARMCEIVEYMNSRKRDVADS